MSGRGGIDARCVDVSRDRSFGYDAFASGHVLHMDGRTYLAMHIQDFVEGTEELDHERCEVRVYDGDEPWDRESFFEAWTGVVDDVPPDDDRLRGSSLTWLLDAARRHPGEVTSAPGDVGSRAVFDRDGDGGRSAGFVVNLGDESYLVMYDLRGGGKEPGHGGMQPVRRLVGEEPTDEASFRRAWYDARAFWAGGGRVVDDVKDRYVRHQCEGSFPFVDDAMRRLLEEEVVRSGDGDVAKARPEWDGVESYGDVSVARVTDVPRF